MFTVAEIVAATGGYLIGDKTATVKGVCTDSRTVVAGELFVPLRGERFDGHNFINEVIGKGVTALLADEAWHLATPAHTKATCIIVKNTLQALGDLAAAYRKRFNMPVIAVTGSNGKTTTKEMLAAILSKTGSGLKTEGNLNNLIGLPQMIFRMKPEHSWAVLEMGMSEPGEIDQLAKIAKPDIGIVLNVFPAHMQSMRSIEAVAYAKGELLHRINDAGLAVVNADDPRVSGLAQNASARRVSFGISRGEIRAKDIEHLGLDGESFRLVTIKGEVGISLKAFGVHNIYNALAATAALMEIVPLDTIAAGLADFRPYKGRFELEKLGDITLVDDSYNANPASVTAALETLTQIAAKGDRIAVLGDMLELGNHEVEAHKTIGTIAGTKVDRLFLCGALMNKFAGESAALAGLSPVSIVRCKNHEELAEQLLQTLSTGDVVLIKGSRGMGMERVANAIRQKISQRAKD